MRGLAVDPEVDKLFMADTENQMIVVTSLDGSGALILINTSASVHALAAERKQR